ncbi:transposase, partial [Acinetobacter baumannii]|uniref:transposase n=1 Tax=Acinetobacter baumannii TaxID=470 RepID=UPI00344B2E6B
DYALRWEIETLFSCLKGRGFNLENTRLTDPRRVKKLIAVLAISFCWCYLTGETIYKCTTVRKWRAFTRRFSSV